MKLKKKLKWIKRDRSHYRSEFYRLRGHFDALLKTSEDLRAEIADLRRGQFERCPCGKAGTYHGPTGMVCRQCLERETEGGPMDNPKAYLRSLEDLALRGVREIDGADILTMINELKDGISDFEKKHSEDKTP